MATGKVKRISAKQAKAARALARIQPPADGRCEKCHKLPDWRGLQKAHKRKRSDGRDDRRSNILWVCAPCHFGPDREIGHRIEGMPKSKPIDKVPGLSGYHHGAAYSKRQQTGRKIIKQQVGKK